MQQREESINKKIAILITNKFKNSKFTSPANKFHKAKHKIITIKKQANKTIKSKKEKASVTINKSINKVTPAKFDALLLPGSHSPNYLHGNNHFVTFTHNFVNSSKPIFAIYHSPQLLISANMIREHKLTTIKPIIINIKNASAKFYNQKVIVNKDQLVTSQTPNNLPAFNRKTLRLLDA